MLVGHGDLAVVLITGVLNGYFLGVAVIGQVGGHDKGKVCGVCRRQLCRALAGGAQVEGMGLRDVILAQVDSAGVALCIIAHRAAISYAVHTLDGRVGDDRNGIINRSNVEGGGLCAPDALDHPVDAVDVFFVVGSALRCGVVQGVVIRSTVQVCLILCHQRMDGGAALNDAALVIDDGILAAVNDGLVVFCVAVIAGRVFHHQLQGAFAVFDRAAVADGGSAGIIGAVIAAVQYSLVGRAVGQQPAVADNIQRRVADNSGLRRFAPAVADVFNAQHRVLHKAVVVKVVQPVQRGVLDGTALFVVHIQVSCQLIFQRAGKDAVVFNRKFHRTGLICHLVEVQRGVLLDDQSRGIPAEVLRIFAVRLKGPAITLCSVDAAVCALGEAVRFNDQFPCKSAVEPDCFRARSKADRAALGVIIQLCVAADNTFQLTGGLQGDTGIGSDIEGTISVCRPLVHRAVRCHRDRKIHRNIGCINGYKPCAFCREIAALDGCALGQRVIFSGEQTAVDGTFISCNIQLVVEQTAIDDDFRCPFKIRERAFKAAAVDDDLFTIVDIHGADALALKGAAVDGKGTRCFNGHAAGITNLFKGAIFNGDLAARSINSGSSLKGAAADDSPGFTDHLAVEGAAGDSACVGHGVAVMVFRADPRLLQGGIGLDLHVPLDAIIVAVIAVITEAEGAGFQGKRLAGLIVGPAVSTVAQIAHGLARVVVYIDIGDITVFLCQSSGAGGVGRGALGKGRQRHRGQCHADEPFLHKILSFLSALPSRALFVVPSVPCFARFGRFWTRIAPQMR